MAIDKWQAESASHYKWGVMDVIDIAKEFAVTQQVEELDAKYYTFTQEDLQAFAHRIEQPLIDRMEAIKAATSILAVQLSEARDELVRLRPEVEGLQNDIRERHLAEGRLMEQIEQLREALQDFSDYVRNEQMATDGAVIYSNTQINRLVFKARKALEEAK